ncbi:MAG: BamA/TamA family outer membrane protein [Pseudomonadota bacterium]
MFARHHRAAAAAALLVAASVLLAPSARAGDPDLRWRTLASDHFRIHHPRAMEPLARRTLDIAEEAYATLRGILGYEPSERVELVIFDDQDSANGLTWTFPYNLIHLYAYPPQVDEQLACSDEWMRMLLTHELVHVFHLDRTTGVLGVVNRLFGKVVQPNQAWPTWFTEGLAVTLETRLTTGGRLRAPRFLEILRMAALEGAFLDLGELNGTPLKLPRANAWYLYGGFFVSWLVERQGLGWLRTTFDRQGRRLVPLSFSILATRAFGATLPKLYEEWRQGTLQAFRAWRDRRDRAGILEGRRLLFAGERNPEPRFAPDGSLLWVDSNGRELSRLRRTHPDGRTDEVTKCHGGCGAPAEDGEGRVWYLSSDLWKGNYYYKDLWVVDGDGTDRKTERLRCRDLALHPPSGQGACVASTPGGTRLLRIDLETLDTETLLDAPPGTGVVLGQPSWTPDGEALVFVWREGGANNLRELDVATGEQRNLTTDGAWYKDPQVHPDGRRVVVSAAPDGVYDLYGLDRCAPGPLVRLTRVLGGAHAPTISPDGARVVYASYHADGYFLHEVDLPPSLVGGASTPRIGPWTGLPQGELVLNPLLQDEEPRPTPYLPFLHLRPRSWVPKVTYEGTRVTSWGMELDASDPAMLHNAWLSFFHYPVTDDLSASLLWTVDMGWPLVSLGASVFQNHLWAFQGDDWQPYEELEGLFSVGVAMPFQRQHRSFRWSVTWSMDVSDGDLEQPVAWDPGARAPWRPTSGRLASVNTGFSYDDTERYSWSVGPERGLHAAVNMRFSAPWVGSEWTEQQLRFSASWYQPLWWRQHTLILQYRAGLADGEPPFRPRFSLGGYPTQDYLRDLLENTGIAGSFLRGFVAGAFSGNEFQYAAVDYRFPLWRIRRGYQTWPIFLDDLVGTVFVNAGYAADGFQPVTHGGLGVGAELALSATLAYYQPLTLTLGYASGFGDGGSHGVYFLLGP